jgi:hypothetical protein
MQPTKSVCPRCGAPMMPIPSDPGSKMCPQCGTRMPNSSPTRPAPSSASQPIKAPTAGPARGILVTDRPRKAAVPVAVPVAPPPPPPNRGPISLMVGAVVAGLMLLLGAGLLLAVLAFVSSRKPLPPVNLAASAENGNSASPAHPPEPANPTRPAGATPTPGSGPAPARPSKGVGDALAGYVPPSKASDTLPPTLTAPMSPEGPDPVWDSLSPAEQERINKAIDRGVEYLRNCAQGNNADPRLNRLGGWALLGLTLLSCKLAPDDPDVRAVIDRVRNGAPQQQQTYDLALAILCLDRLGDPKDEDLIRMLTARLMIGQLPSGGWTYPCNGVRQVDEEQFLKLLETVSPPAANASLGSAPTLPPAMSMPGRPAMPRPGLRGAPIDPNTLPIMQFQPGNSLKGQRGGDNSNTQFAIMAVWVARKHGLPVDRTLAMIEARFRSSQNADGSWGYTENSSERPDSMTCAGLLGLGVGQGIVRAPDARGDAPKDAQIEKGLKFLSRSIGKDGGGGRGGPRMGTGRILGVQSLGDLYYLWSLERVAVAYDLQTIGGKAWYPWGANVLVEHQQPDGNWVDNFPGTIDTCFALLFLKRANVARDLTARLKNLGNLAEVEDDKKRPK